MNVPPINNPSNSSPAAAPATPTAQATPQQHSDQRKLIQAVKTVNASGSVGPENELTYILDRASRRAVARIVNRKTGEVVEQIPAEYVLRMAEELKGS